MQRRVCDLPTGIHGFIAPTAELALERGDHARDHGVWGRARFQHLPHRPLAEAGIGSYRKLPQVGRGGVKAASQQFLTARPGAGIAPSQFHIPQEGGVGFQTEQWVIGPLAAIAWVVAYRCPVLAAKNGNDGATVLSKSRINRER